MPLRKIRGLKARLFLIVLLAMLPVLCMALFMAVQDYREAKLKTVEDSRRLTKAYATSGAALLERARMLMAQMVLLPGMRGLDKDASQKILSGLDPQKNTYRSISLLRPDGQLVSSSLPHPSAVSYAKQEWFREALRSKSFVVGRFIAEGESGGPELPLAQPLLEPDGSVRMVLALTVDLRSLDDILDDWQLPDGASVSIIDRNGTVLARFPDEPGLVGHSAPGAEDFLPALLSQGQDTLESKGLDGVKRIYFLSPLTGRNDRALFLRMGMPAEIAFAPATRNLERNLSFIAVMTAFILVATWFFSNSLVLKHIQRLWLATKKLTEGDYAYRVGPMGGGELGQLALAFDHMAGVLEQKTTQLVRAERNYRKIFENSVNGIFQTTPGGRIQNANQALADILGYKSPGELIEKVQDITTQIYTNPAQRREIISRLEREGVVSGLEVATRSSDGRQVWLSLDVRAVFDAEGSMVACEGSATNITKRKRVEHELEIKQEKLQGLLEYSPALICIRDAQGRYVLSNRKHQECHNLDGRITGLHVRDLFQPDVAGKLLAEDQEVLREGKSQSYQRPLPTLQGVRHFMAVKFPLFDENHRPDRVCTISYDITDLERIRESLRQSEEKYRTMIQTSPDLIWMIDPQGVLVEVNSASRDLIGYEPEELRGKHFQQFFYPEDLREHERECVLSTLVGRKQGQFLHPKLINERRQLPRSTRNLNLRLIPKSEVFEEHGPRSFELSSCGLWQDMRFLGTIVVIRDVTERRRTETALRQSRELLAQTQSMARIGGWTMNLDTRARSWTEETCQLLGLNGREMPDFSTCADFLATEDRAAFIEAFERAEDLDEGFDLELRLAMSGSQQRWVRIKAQRADADGERLLSGMVQDITDRMNLELLRSDIDGIIRHDLKAPLNGIINLPQIMRADKNLSGNQLELLQYIEDCGRKMLRQIDMSLDLMKIEREQYQVTPVSFDLMPMLRDILGTVQGSAESKRVRLVIRGGPQRPEDPFLVRGEERLCYPLLTNLIVNALEASPPGEEVCVSLSETLTPGGMVAVVCIRNQGVIPPHIRGSFFEKYVTSGKTTGTGLGTYSARLFARAQGGGVELDASEPGATTLIVHLLRG